MKNFISFVCIPSVNFERAVKFYENVLGIQLNAVCECETEKMAYFPDENGICPGSISWEKNFSPSKDGVLIHLRVENMETTMTAIEENGGKIVKPKTKIEADGWGYFCMFIDSEGNRMGLYSEK
jgi:predicted enzyme related to lactoylglutathione lyase